jgi:hypothetical protein
MKIVIKIGNVPNLNKVEYKPSYLDNPILELQNMDKILLQDNVTIYDCTHYLLYQVNNLMMRYIVSNNKDIPIELKERPNLNPKFVKIISINENGDEIIIQDNEGLIHDNYFDKLMKNVMDDFYKSLNYYGDSSN